MKVFHFVHLTHVCAYLFQVFRERIDSFETMVNPKKEGGRGGRKRGVSHKGESYQKWSVEAMAAGKGKLWVGFQANRFVWTF